MPERFVTIAVQDLDLRLDCRDALTAEGYRLTVPTTLEGARYILESPQPPEAVLFSASESWKETLSQAVAGSVVPPAVVVVAPSGDDWRKRSDAIREAVDRALARRGAPH